MVAGDGMDWTRHLYRAGSHTEARDDLPTDADALDAFVNGARRNIEPWLSAVFQAEHLNLLVGSGFTTAIGCLAGAGASGMSRVVFGTPYDAAIDKHTQASAAAMKRGAANIEDQLRSALAVLGGLAVTDTDAENALKKAIDVQLSKFLTSLLSTESGIFKAKDNSARQTAEGALQSFLLSFASRAASRERLHIFTTNYDRLIERGCDLAGLRTIDRFVGALNPVFRASRVEVEHALQSPRDSGEPRFMEGIVPIHETAWIAGLVFRQGRAAYFPEGYSIWSTCGSHRHPEDPC